MNSSTSEAVWPTPDSAHRTAQHISDSTQAALVALVATDILAAVSSGLFTVDVPVSGQTSVDVQYVMALLSQGGYVCSNSGSDIVINW